MSTHPLNLAFRFLLELAAYVAIGYWGWHSGAGFSRFLFALGAPLLWAVLWGTFAVPDDPSRSGKAPVPVPGVLRLALELAFFGFAAWALHDTGATSLGLALASLVLVHYVLSYDRCVWLVTGRSMGNS